MDTVKNTFDLVKIRADRKMVDSLSAHGLLLPEAREAALELLYPVQNWRLLVGRALLTIGTALVLSGIIYFFAFNWNRIPPLVKLGSIQTGMLLCIAGALFYGLRRVSGQVLLTSAAVLTGVFLAVFGQVYQTGADAYNLFVAWALLILPWSIAGRYAPLWTVWIAVTNVALVCWWDQAAQPSNDSQLLIASYLAILNGIFLLCRELLAKSGSDWLDARWTRVTLVVLILLCVGIPGFLFIVDVAHADNAIVIGTVLCAFVNGAFMFTYRYILPDMWCLAATILSLCLLTEAAGIRILAEGADGAAALFTMGAFTIGLFTMATIWIRTISRKVEIENA